MQLTDLLKHPVQVTNSKTSTSPSQYLAVGLTASISLGMWQLVPKCTVCGLTDRQTDRQLCVGEAAVLQYSTLQCGREWTGENEGNLTVSYRVRYNASGTAGGKELLREGGGGGR
jgi:hypothetical protein